MLQELYKEIILDHFRRPRHRQEVEGAEIEEHLNNPLCGDEVTVYANLGDGGLEVAHTGRGCAISQASASMLLEKMQGKSVEDAKQFSAEDMLKLYGARLTPNRQKCCLLSWKVLQSAVHSPIGRDGE